MILSTGITKAVIENEAERVNQQENSEAPITARVIIIIISLWRYNAKMILRQYSLTAEDELPDFDIG